MRIALVTLLVVGNAFAAGDGGHGHLSDLIAPAVNFFLLTGLLLYKLKAPIRNMFVQKADTLTETLERANLKSKEAQVMLETQEKKLANLSNEISQIKSNSEKEVQNFETKYTDEIDKKSKKLKEDVASKIEAERKSMLNAINAKLIDQVIKKTTDTVKANKDVKSKINNKIIQEIR